MNSNLTSAGATQARCQRGVITLTLSTLLLIAVTLVVFTSSQGVVTQQRVISNERRAQQAFEAAFAGHGYATGYFQTFGGDLDANDSLDTLLGYPNWTYVSGTSGPSYRVRFVDDVLVGNLAVVTIEAQGRSDDQGAVRTIREQISSTPAVANAPDNPLTSRGFVDLKGSGTITNLESSLTIWSGDSVDVTGNSPKTIIKHPTAAGGIESTNKNNKGLDVIDNDANLSTLTDDDYFRNFFGLSPSDYRSRIVRTDIDPDTTAVTTLDGKKGEVIWVDGDASFTSNTQIGTADQPVVLVVDGNMFGAGTVTVYGILFVSGDWDAQGNLTVNGAAIMRGNVDGTGSLDVIFDSSVLDNVAFVGKPVAVPGTWRDW
ncbi:PilX N-terminal domain-containing pilus assembly protein [Marinobacterium arenosum]|uniref:PilX N-terminal domain-containing pilus assembly protein n=1 Tax=Marinobacterium arenosum TaxID=2862496 RepID=UPI001C96829F|nr:PilX N-terminal domain-containing pilus assembly protein [Marinobacterium arenosum]MBY4678237.1 hypothetical protein [Marinobacterium arenosum]